MRTTTNITANGEKLQRDKHEILKPKKEYCPF